MTRPYQYLAPRALMALSMFAVAAAFVPTPVSHAHVRQPLLQNPPFLSATNLFQDEKGSNLMTTPSSNASTASKLVSVFLPFILASSLAFPATAAGPTNSIFTNDYADPLHPQCRRHIEVNADGTSFHYSGTAVGSENDSVLRGCSPAEIKEFGIRRGAFDGTIDLAVKKISAGDGIHEGVWEPANSVRSTNNLGYEDVDGIRWNDGNKWIVQQKTVATQVGEFITFSYIGFSLLAGVKGVYNMYEKNKAETSSD